MPNYEAISKEFHFNKRWKLTNNFKFTAQDALCPLVMQELPKIALYMPIAFSKAGDHFEVFAVLGLTNGSNYLVDDDGRWLAGYIPAAYRSYPFTLAATDENKEVLCIDVESGQLSETEGNSFFDEDGEPTAKIKETLDFLTSVATNRKLTLSLCLLLEKLDLLEPWPITVTTKDGEMPVKGLSRVNEVTFNALDAETLAELRNKGALSLIFCQLISMQNLARIAELAQARTVATLPDELDLDFNFGSDEGNISFEGL